MFNKSKLWAISLLAAAFVAGVAVGGVAAAGWSDGGRARDRGARREEVSYLDRLDRELQLTAAQRDSVAVILKRYDEPMRQLWQAQRRGFDSLRVQVRSDINWVLDDSQRSRFRTMNQRMDSLRAVREHGGTPRGR